MTLAPSKLYLRDPETLVVQWDDGQSRYYSIRELREACPCATCLEKRRKPEKQPAATGLLPVISAAEMQPLKIVKMEPVGNYAYSIHFSDGHNTGIYRLDLLRQLGRLEPKTSS